MRNTTWSGLLPAVRAQPRQPALQAGCRWFESTCAHQAKRWSAAEFGAKDLLRPLSSKSRILDGPEAIRFGWSACPQRDEPAPGARLCGGRAARVAAGAAGLAGQARGACCGDEFVVALAGDGRIDVGVVVHRGLLGLASSCSVRLESAAEHP